MKRNPFRKRPLIDLFERIDRFLDRNGNGIGYITIAIIIVAFALWLFAPIEDIDVVPPQRPRF